MPGCHCQAVAPPQPLIQLRRRFTAACSQIRLSVQTEADGWMALVSDSENGATLYSAYRCSMGAAKVAAADFAAFRLDGPAGPTNPERMAQQLTWIERS